MIRKDKNRFYKRDQLGNIKEISDTDISIYLGHELEDRDYIKSIVSFCNVCNHNTVHYLVYEKGYDKYECKRVENGFLYECEGCADRVLYGPGYDEILDHLLRLNGVIY
jgi:hypothetical protein